MSETTESLRRKIASAGDLEGVVRTMKALAASNIGQYEKAVSALGEAKKTMDQQVTVRREQDKLPAWMREEIRTGVEDGIPKGYEEMAGEYFRVLAEEGAK